MMRFGIVTQLDPAGARVRVEFPDEDYQTEKDERGMESYWLQVMHHNTGSAKMFCMPSIGEQVATMMDERMEFGVVMGGVYSEADARPDAPDTAMHMVFADGTVVEYDPASHALKADVQGTVDIKATDAVTVDAQGDVMVKAPNVTVDATDSATVKAPTAMVDASTTATVKSPVITLQGFVHITGGLQIDGVVTGAGGGGSVTFSVPVTMQAAATFQSTINATGAIDSLAGMTKAGTPYNHP